jgi:hypothetical protein
LVTVHTVLAVVTASGVDARPTDLPLAAHQGHLGVGVRHHETTDNWAVGAQDIAEGHTSRMTMRTT